MFVSQVYLHPRGCVGSARAAVNRMLALLCSSMGKMRHCRFAGALDVHLFEGEKRTQLPMNFAFFSSRAHSAPYSPSFHRWL